MRERSSGNIRIDTGIDTWEFENQNNNEIKIRHQKIFISSMLEFPSEALDLLYDFQCSKKVTSIILAESRNNGRLVKKH